MTIQGIDIQVSDGVSPAIQQKIDAIADSADKAQGAIDKLAAKLKTLDAQPFVKLAQAYTALNDGINKNNLAYLQQEAALNKAITAETNAQAATLKLQQAQDKATAAATAAANANVKLADSHVAVFTAIQNEKNATQKLAAQQDAQAAFNKLLGVGTTPTNSAKASAAVFAEAFAQEAAAAKKASAEVKAADAITEHFGFTTARSRTELLVLAHELAQGRYKNFGQSLMVLGEQTGIMGVAFTGAGAAIIGATAALAAFVYYSTAGSAKTASLTRTLQATNNYAGLTTDSLYAMAASVGTLTNTSQASSLAIAQALTATGQLQSNQIRNLTASAQLLAKYTGQSTDEIVKDFAKAADAPSKYAVELDKSLNFLSTAQLQEIRELEQRGEKTEALTKLSSDLYGYLSTKAPPQLSTLSEAWHSVTKAISDANEALKEHADPQTYEGKVAQIKKQIEDAKRLADEVALARAGGIGIGAKLGDYGKNPAVQALEMKLSDLREQRNASEAAAAQAGKDAQIQALGKQALEGADAFLRFGNNVNGAAEKIAEFRKTVSDILAADPTNKVGLQLQAQQKQIEDAIKKQYEGKQGRAEESGAEVRKRELDKYIRSLDDEAAAIGLVGDARERVLQLEKLDSQLKAIKNNKQGGLTDSEKAALNESLAIEQQNKRINEAGNALDSYVNGPRRAYDASLIATAELLSRGTISEDQAREAVNRATIAYQKAIDPLYEFNKGIEDQTALNGKFGESLAVAARLQQAQNQLEAAGKTLKDGNAASLAKYNQTLEQHIAASVHSEAVNRELQGIWQQGPGTLEAIRTRMEALALAYNKGAISAERFGIEMNKARMAEAQAKIDMGNGSWSDAATASLAKFQESYKGVVAGATEAFGNFFDSFASGAADAFGKAITGQESFKDAINQTAKEALGNLISALIKIGIQYLINAAIGNTVAETTAGTSAALASATATAWAPAAALVNAATFGAGADAADVSLPITLGVAEGIAASGFMSGGYTGNMPTNAVAGVVHGQEFVATAAATARNRPVLEAMNRGATFSTGDGSGAFGKGGRGKVEVHNYTGTGVQTQQNDDVTRIIVGQELAKKLPKAMAGEASNPNSPYSKTMRRTTNIRRRTA